jgi:hypothetical protein
MQPERKIIPNSSKPTQGEMENLHIEKSFLQKKIPKLVLTGFAMAGSVMAQENRPNQSASNTGVTEQVQSVEKQALSYEATLKQKIEVGQKISEAEKLNTSFGEKIKKEKEATDNYHASESLTESSAVKMPESLPVDKQEAVAKLRALLADLVSLEKKLQAELDTYKKNLSPEKNVDSKLTETLMQLSDSFDDLVSFIKSEEFKKLPADKQKQVTDWHEEFKQKYNSLINARKQNMDLDDGVSEKSEDIQRNLLEAISKVLDLNIAVNRKIIELEK